MEFGNSEEHLREAVGVCKGARGCAKASGGARARAGGVAQPLARLGVVGCVVGQPRQLAAELGRPAAPAAHTQCSVAPAHDPGLKPVGGVAIVEAVTGSIRGGGALLMCVQSAVAECRHSNPRWRSPRDTGLFAALGCLRRDTKNAIAVILVLSN